MYVLANNNETYNIKHKHKYNKHFAKTNKIKTTEKSIEEKQKQKTLG